jgi:hypothetical protein
MAHTLGPWRIDDKTGAVVADYPTGHDGLDNLEYYGGHLVCESIRWGDNRKIIASAPELLDAVKCALGYLTGNMDGSMDLGDPVEMLRAAIAKATGEK